MVFFAITSGQEIIDLMELHLLKMETGKAMKPHPDYLNKCGTCDYWRRDEPDKVFSRRHCWALSEPGKPLVRVEFCDTCPFWKLSTVYEP